MNSLGSETLQPFLQDVIQPVGLTKTLAKVVLSNPGIVPGIIRHVGIGAIVEVYFSFSLMETHSLCAYVYLFI